MFRKYPAVLVLAHVVAGIVLADLTRLPSEAFLLLTIVSGLVGVAAVARQHRAAAWVLSACIGFAAAMQLSLQFYDPGPRSLKYLVEEGGHYECLGQVVDWPVIKSHETRIKLRVDSLGQWDKLAPVDGCLLLHVSDTATTVQVGDRLRLATRLYTVKGNRWPQGWDYGRYQHLKGIFAVGYLSTLNDVQVRPRAGCSVWLAVDGLRRAIRGGLQEHLSSLSACLAAGFLIGETRNIPPELYRWFRDSGTLHLLAVSGSNVALVVLFVMVLLRPLGLSSRWRAPVLMLAIAVFALICYGEPSVVRASLMAGLILLARMIQRPVDLNNTIALGALIILLIAPAQFYDVGFQLSFVTAWGLIFVLPQVTRLFGNRSSRWWFRWLVFPILVPLVAQICAAPISVLYFQRLPLVSPLANLVIIPVVSAAVIGGLVLVLASTLGAALGQAVSWVVDPLLRTTAWLVQLFGEGEKVQDIPGVDVLTVVGAYVIIAVGALALSRRAYRMPCLMALLLVVNWTLARSIAITVASGARLELTVFGLRPGAAVAVRYHDGTEGDLILTDAIGRQYPLDEFVVGPALSRIGLKRLRSIIVLKADYTALEDILRLAASCKARQVWLPPPLGASAADVISLGNLSLESSRVRSIERSPSSQTHDDTGYFVSGRSLLALWPGAGLLYCSEPSACPGLPMQNWVEKRSLVLVTDSDRTLPALDSSSAERGKWAAWLVTGRQRRSDRTAATASGSWEGLSPVGIDSLGAVRLRIYDLPQKPPEVTIWR